MSAPASHRSPRARAIAIASAAACAALVAAIAIHSASAGAVTSRVIQLGKTRSTPAAACPSQSNCTVIGKVTGFQRQIGGTGGVKNPFVSPVTGRIVAWTVTTSKPTTAQRKFFNDLFGSPPIARLAVLTKTADKPVPKYKLLRQSPRQELTAYMGERTTFTLRESLFIKRGQVVALTVPTWVPAFGVGLSSNNKWRASREPGKCNTGPGHLDNAKASRAQQKVGSIRRYACDYNQARLLYTAYVATTQ